MATIVGKRYVAPSGAEVIVTKGGSGDISDNEMPLFLKENVPAGMHDESGRDEPKLQLGKRYKSADGEVEILVLRPGVCDLRYNGVAMEVLQPRVLPSAD